MNITFNPPTPVRFAGAPKSTDDDVAAAVQAKKDKQEATAAVGRLRKSFEEIDGSLDNVHYISANQDTPDTPVKQAKSRLKKGRRAWAMMMLAAVLGGSAVVGGQAAKPVQPSDTVMSQKAGISPQWTDLEIASNVPNTDDSQAERAFELKSEAFIDQLIVTMQQYPSSQLDAGMIAKLQQAIKQDQGYQPTVTAHKLGMSLIKWLNNNAQLKPGSSSTEIHLAEGSIKEWINNTPELQKLNDTQKADLLKQIERVVAQPASEYNLNGFDDIMLANLGGNGYAGVTLKDFAHLDSTQDAVNLFQAAVNNPENFNNLTSGERAAFLKSGTQVLSSLDAEQSSMVAYWMLMLVGLAGIGAMGAFALVNRKNLNMLSASSDLKQAIKQPHLIVTNAEQADKSTQAKLIRYNDKIDTNTEAASKTMRTVFQNNAVVKKFLLDLFVSEEKLPDAGWFRNRYIYEAVQDLLANQTEADKKAEKPVGEVALLEQVYSESEAAAVAGNILKAPKLTKEEAPPAGESTKESLQREYNRVDNMVVAALTAYANAMFGKSAAEESLAAKEQALEDAKAKFKEVGEANKDASGELQMNDAVTAAFSLKKTAEQDVTFAKERMESAESMAGHAEDILDQYIEPLREYRSRIKEALAKSENNATLKELQKVSEESGKAEQDEFLQKALYEQALDKAMEEQQEAARKVQDAVKARVDAKLAEMEAAEKEGA